MNKIQYISIAVIVISFGIGGYLVLGSQHQSDSAGLTPIVDGKQVIKMTVLAVDYSPRFFTVKAGVPVRWEITSSGQAGCAAGSIISKILPNGSLYLNSSQGQVTVAEFTPKTAGVYRFACPMGMAKGTIQVVN